MDAGTDAATRAVGEVVTLGGVWVRSTVGGAHSDISVPVGVEAPGFGVARDIIMDAPNVIYYTCTGGLDTMSEVNEMQRWRKAYDLVTPVPVVLSGGVGNSAQDSRWAPAKGLLDAAPHVLKLRFICHRWQPVRSNEFVELCLSLLLDLRE